jgi:hypothetical protein
LDDGRIVAYRDPGYAFGVQGGCAPITDRARLQGGYYDDGIRMNGRVWVVSADRL